MRNNMRTVFIACIAVMLQWSFQVHAGTQCFGNCDSYVNYYCDPSEDNCEPCLHEGDAPKCKEYFDSLRKPATSDPPKDTPLTTPISHNDTVRLGDSKPASPVKLKQETETNKERHQPTGQKGLISLPGNTDKTEKHTTVIIVLAILGMLGFVATLFVCVVVQLRLRKQHETNTTTVMTSDDDGVLLGVVTVNQSKGAAKGPTQAIEG